MPFRSSLIISVGEVVESFLPNQILSQTLTKALKDQSTEESTCSTILENTNQLETMTFPDRKRLCSTGSSPSNISDESKEEEPIPFDEPLYFKRRKIQLAKLLESTSFRCSQDQEIICDCVASDSMPSSTLNSNGEPNEDINNMYVSFEHAPLCEGWYETILRQEILNSCEEVKLSTKILLPYEMPISKFCYNYETAQERSCRLTSSNRPSSGKSLKARKLFKSSGKGRKSPRCHPSTQSLLLDSVEQIHA